jgi:hypothetical protein
MKTLLIAGALLTGMIGAVGTAEATTIPPACPQTNFTNATTTPANCNLVITFGANGAVTTTVPVGATANYDGSDDTLVGVFNNSGHTIFSFVLNGGSQPIFGFDGDGIDTLAITTITRALGNPDTTGYGGMDAFFTAISGNIGTVNFVGGIASGGFDYFSLEAPVVLTALPVVTPAPEPMTLTLLGVGMLGTGIAARRRRQSATTLTAG